MRRRFWPANCITNNVTERPGHHVSLAPASISLRARLSTGEFKEARSTIAQAISNVMAKKIGP